MNNKDDNRIEEIKALEKWRKEHGISQEAMARKLDVALVTYSSWVTGKSLKVSTDNYFKIGTLLTRLIMTYLYCPTKDLYIEHLTPGMNVPEITNREPYTTCPICADPDCEWNYQRFGDFVNFDDIEGPKVLGYAYTYLPNDDRIIMDKNDDRIEGSLKAKFFSYKEIKWLAETATDRVEGELVEANKDKV